MTVRDFIKRITEEDMDKMLVISDGRGWANITICKSDCEITIKPDYSTPFSDDGCYATGGIVDPEILPATYENHPSITEMNSKTFNAAMDKLALKLGKIYSEKGGIHGSNK